MDDNPVENVETLLKAYWDLAVPLNKARLKWFRYEVGTRSILKPSILVELGEHWYDPSAGKIQRYMIYQEIYITSMDATKSGIESRHNNLWDMRTEVERIIKNYPTSATDIRYIRLPERQRPKSWRIDKQWKPYEVDIICMYEL